MRTTVIAAMTVVALASGGTAPALAKGCLKGAAVGGLAGHMAGHGVLGAAAGCAIGHHEATKHANESMAAQQQHEQPLPEHSNVQ